MKGEIRSFSSGCRGLDRCVCLYVIAQRWKWGQSRELDRCVCLYVIAQRWKWGNQGNQSMAVELNWGSYPEYLIYPYSTAIETGRINGKSHAIVTIQKAAPSKAQFHDSNLQTHHAFKDRATIPHAIQSFFTSLNQWDYSSISLPRPHFLSPPTSPCPPSHLQTSAAAYSPSPASSGVVDPYPLLPDLI